MENSDTFKSITIGPDTTILDAIKQMDRIKRKLLLVARGKQFESLLSIGDIQRAIIRGDKFETPIGRILRDAKKIRVAHVDQSFEQIKETMLQYKTEFMPVINSAGDIEKLYFWEDLFGKPQKSEPARLVLPAVIMAGGEGRRLRPITNVLPKALLPIGQKPIVQIIAEQFASLGTKDIFLSVNYKHEMIRHFFEELPDKSYNVHYIQEDKPLGTAGSLGLIGDKIQTTFFVSNCDILVEQDLAEVYNYHSENHNELTIVSALKHYPIPYGTLQTGPDGILESISEKPEFTLQVNTGMYILEPHLLQEIPSDTFFHITHLIEKIRQRKGKVGVFPVTEKSWTDIGKWQEYQKLFDLR